MFGMQIDVRATPRGFIAEQVSDYAINIIEIGKSFEVKSKVQVLNTNCLLRLCDSRIVSILFAGSRGFAQVDTPVIWKLRETV